MKCFTLVLCLFLAGCSLKTRNDSLICLGACVYNETEVKDKKLFNLNGVKDEKVIVECDR